MLCLLTINMSWSGENKIELNFSNNRRKSDKMEYHDILSLEKDARVYQIEFLLWKDQWDSYTEPPVKLNWECVKFEEKSRSLIPSEKGIYAFFVDPEITSFPSHRYLMYIGQAGHNSKRNLRSRFSDYLNEKKRIKRISINYLLNTWQGHLYFCFTVVPPDLTNIKELERKLLDTFTPPFSDRGYSAKIGHIRRLLKI